MASQATEQSIVVCICGTLAAGKTTLIRSLSQRLKGSAMLVFDEYQSFTEWPQDFAQWLAQGCDPAAVSNARLKADLQSLRSGAPCDHPIDGHTINPSPIIFLEDPFGRTRPDNRDLIDLVLFVELPWDLSVVRMTQRALGVDERTEPTALGDISKRILVGRIESTRAWLSGYVARRDMYTSLSEPVRATADAILDGTQAVDVVLADALEAIDRAVQR